MDATRAGLKLSETEIRYRVQCATIYDSEAKVAKALGEFGSWSGLIQARFPEVEVDESDEVDEIEEVGLAASDSPDDWTEDPLFEIPGFKPVLKINGRKVDLAEATVRQAVTYRDIRRPRCPLHR